MFVIRKWRDNAVYIFKILLTYGDATAHWALDWSSVNLQPVFWANRCLQFVVPYAWRSVQLDAVQLINLNIYFDRFIHETAS